MFVASEQQALKQSMNNPVLANSLDGDIERIRNAFPKLKKNQYYGGVNAQNYGSSSIGKANDASAIYSNIGINQPFSRMNKNVQRVLQGINGNLKRSAMPKYGNKRINTNSIRRPLKHTSPNGHEPMYTLNPSSIGSPGNASAPMGFIRFEGIKS